MNQIEKEWAKAWSKFAGFANSAHIKTGLKLCIASKATAPEGLSERVSEQALARQAEAEMSKEIGAEILRSRSHTQVSQSIFALVVGVECSSAPSIRSIGVDLEGADRPVSEAVAKRVIQESEMAWLTSGALSALDFWVLKEAAFKATPDNDGAVISSFYVTEWDAERGEGLIRSPLLDRQNLTCRVMKLEKAGLKAAFAYSFETSS